MDCTFRGLRESGVASALAAGCRRDRRDSTADGLKLLVAAGHPDSGGHSAAYGPPCARDRHPRQRQARRQAARMGRRTSSRSSASQRGRWRPTPTRPGSPRWRTPTAIWPGRRSRVSAWWKVITAPIAVRASRRTAT